MVVPAACRAHSRTRNSHCVISHATGAELVLQRGSRYGLAYGQSLTFAEITEAVRGEGDTVIGVLEEGGVATACRPSDRFVLQPGSRLVTITQDYARSMMLCGD